VERGYRGWGVAAQTHSACPRAAAGPPIASGGVTRLWTGAGDDGTTGLLFGGRVPKSSDRPEAIGSVDEAQAAIGLARAEAPRGSELDSILTGLERDLWVLMAEIATDPANRSKLVDDTTLVTATMVQRIEALVDEIGSRFEPPSEFVVPGQDRQSALLDLARTVVRRAERAAAAVADEGSHVIPYLNRLSSVLWTLARWVEGEALTSRRA
jgi:cob(I)alamin adenosyltransferase